MKNNDRLYKPDEISNEKLKEFSEGCSSLYETLLYCYQNNIPTLACCKGHKDTISKPYLSFYAQDYEKMYNLVAYLMNSSLANKIVCTVSYMDFMRLNVYVLKLSYRDQFFKLIKEGLNNKKLNNDYSYLFEMQQMLKKNINIYAGCIEIENPIYKKIIGFKDDEPVLSDDEIKPGDKVCPVNIRKLYLPDDVEMIDINPSRIIREAEIFKDIINIPCSIMIDDEFVLEFFHKLKQKEDSHESKR